ncbi:MAG: hypothetical protein GQ546_14405 [Gammaproteobacteria bacterium]|nr:hypothetical protein [Gammaproteobacteria bacterium]
MLKLTLSGKLNKDINMPVMGGLGHEELLSDKTKIFLFENNTRYVNCTLQQFEPILSTLVFSKKQQFQ